MSKSSAINLEISMHIICNHIYLLPYFVYIPVSTPTVNVTAPNEQIVGQSLTLQCVVTTVRGITSRADIVWKNSNGMELDMTGNIMPTMMTDSLVYTDSYTISQLSTTDDGRVIQCEVVINANPPVKASNSIILHVTGMIICTYVINILYII